MIKPAINVTPLIDVLLVLLIIFMVISPLKPSRFEAKIPQEPHIDGAAAPSDLTLVVSLDADHTLALNNEKNLGTVADAEKLSARLREVFRQRKENRVYSAESALKSELSEDDKIEKTVFIKAPRRADYGSVARIVDAVKQAGARPISLQIDDLQ